VGVIAFLTLLNCRGVQEGKIVQNVMTVAKTLALIVLILVGILVVSNTAAHEANYTDWWSGIMTTTTTEKLSEKLGMAGTVLALMVVGGAMVGALFSADAWNNITFTAGEIKNPRRNLPLSLAFGTGMVIILYMLANYAYLQALPVRGVPSLEKTVRSEQKQAEYLEETAKKLKEQGKTAEAKAKGDEAKAAKARADDALQKATTAQRGIAYAKDDRVGTAVMELWSTEWGATFMAIAIMISTFGCVNGMILMGARLYYVMAQDNLFFRSVGTLNRRGVPAMGLILQSAWSILLIFSGTYSDLLDYVIFAVLVFYVLTVSGLFILRRKMPTAERPYKAFGYPILPALYVLLCAIIMIDLLIVKPKYTWPGLIIVLTGIPVYFLWRAFGKRAA
jgi:APA family basic amino acid/polyamine antiporter